MKKFRGKLLECPFCNQKPNLVFDEETKLFKIEGNCEKCKTFNLSRKNKYYLARLWNLYVLSLKKTLETI